MTSFFGRTKKTPSPAKKKFSRDADGLMTIESPNGTVTNLEELLRGIDPTELLKSVDSKTLMKLHSKPSLIKNILQDRSHECDATATGYVTHLQELHLQELQDTGHEASKATMKKPAPTIKFKKDDFDVDLTGDDGVHGRRRDDGQGRRREYARSGSGLSSSFSEHSSKRGRSPSQDSRHPTRPTSSRQQDLQPISVTLRMTPHPDRSVALMSESEKNYYENKRSIIWKSLQEKVATTFFRHDPFQEVTSLELSIKESSWKKMGKNCKFCIVASILDDYVDYHNKRHKGFNKKCMEVLEGIVEQYSEMYHKTSEEIREVSPVVTIKTAVR